MTSASRAIGARLACASCTSRMICCSVVSRPTRVARKRKLPVEFTLPPNTPAPGSLSTGSDSPVSIDSSTADVPSTTSPSTGTRSPGLTMTMSPRRRPATGTSDSTPSRTTSAVRGWRSIRRLMASEVRPLRARLEQPAEEHEGDDCGCHLEVHAGRVGHRALRAGVRSPRRARRSPRRSRGRPRRCRRRSACSCPRCGGGRSSTRRGRTGSRSRR